MTDSEQTEAVHDFAEDLENSLHDADIDGYGDEGAGYDFEKQARLLIGLGYRQVGRCRRAVVSQNMYTPDWVLQDTSTVYMDGTAVYDLHHPGQPGIVARLVLPFDQAQLLREVITECLEMIEA